VDWPSLSTLQIPSNSVGLRTLPHPHHTSTWFWGWLRWKPRLRIDMPMLLRPLLVVVGLYTFQSQRNFSCCRLCWPSRSTFGSRLHGRRRHDTHSLLITGRPESKWKSPLGWYLVRPFLFFRWSGSRGLGGLGSYFWLCYCSDIHQGWVIWVRDRFFSCRCGGLVRKCWPFEVFL